VLDAHPGTRLFVAGPGDASDQLKDADPPAASATHVLGTVSDVDKASLLRSVDAYVAPHLGGESFGIVLVEAMAAGVPVVASDIPGYRDVVGDAGMLVPPGDPAALARALDALLADGAERERLAAAGTREARRFAWPHVAQRVLAVYERVVA
jgi:phosphatidylinositol alpha-mannosyltransferase